MKTLIENQTFLVSFLIVWGFIQSLYFAIFMGLILRWNDAKGEQRTKVGKLWHGWAALVKVGIPVLWLPTYFALDLNTWLLVGISFIWFNWVGWDGILNMCRLTLDGNWLQRFFYSGSKSTGTTSIIEIKLGEYLPFIKMSYTVAAIIGIIMLLTL